MNLHLVESLRGYPSLSKDFFHARIQRILQVFVKGGT